MKIIHVEQKGKFDCAIACLSMILKKDHEEIDKRFRNNFNVEGVRVKEVVRYLVEQGLLVIVKECAGFPTLEAANKKLLEPFADVHYISAKQYSNSKYNHAVVMDKNGIMFDPGDKKHKDWDILYDIEFVVGIFYPK